MRLFDSPGKSIKTVAAFMFWLSASIYCLGSLIFFIHSLLFEARDALDVFLALLLFVAALVIGLFALWFFWLLIRGYGELVDKSADATVELDDVKTKLDDIKVDLENIARNQLDDMGHPLYVNK